MFTVLVAENEPWVLKGLVEMVKAVGDEFEIVGACSNGEEAWRVINEVWPMLLITDIMMPELDGLSLIQRTQELPLVSIIISGYDNFQYAQKAMSYGVSEYLLKPVEFDVLRETLRRSKKKLESLEVLNGYIAKFQALLDNYQGLALKQVMRKQADLMQSVLRMNLTNVSARINLLHLFEHKLNMLFKDAGIAVAAATQYNALDDDDAIMREHTARLEKWYLRKPSEIKLGQTEIIEKACQYIKEHFKEEITLTEMAALTNFSISHFTVLFKKHTGISLVGYVNKLRVDEAKKRLATTSFSVTEIAEMVGFATIPYFTRVFKSIAGLSPMEYRKRINA